MHEFLKNILLLLLLPIINIIIIIYVLNVQMTICINYLLLFWPSGKKIYITKIKPIFILIYSYNKNTISILLLNSTMSNIYQNNSIVQTDYPKITISVSYVGSRQVH